MPPFLSFIATSMLTVLLNLVTACLHPSHCLANIELSPPVHASAAKVPKARVSVFSLIYPDYVEGYTRGVRIRGEGKGSVSWCKWRIWGAGIRKLQHEEILYTRRSLSRRGERVCLGGGIGGES